MLREKAALLEEEIANYKQIDSLKIELDSVRVETIKNLNENIDDLNKTIYKQRVGLQITSCSLLTCIICLLIL